MNFELQLGGVYVSGLKSLKHGKNTLMRFSMNGFFSHLILQTAHLEPFFFFGFIGVPVREPKFAPGVGDLLRPSFLNFLWGGEGWKGGGRGDLHRAGLSHARRGDPGGGGGRGIWAFGGDRRRWGGM